MTFGSGGSSAERLLQAGFDADHLLAGYRSARAQEALFDLRWHTAWPASGYDEFVDRDGNVRPAWAELADAIADRGRGGAGLAALGGAQPDRQRRHHLHRRRTRSGFAEHSNIKLSPDPGSWTPCRSCCPPRTGRRWRPGCYSGHGCSMPCWATCTGPRNLLDSRRHSLRNCCSAIPVTCAPPVESKYQGVTQLFMHACDVSRQPENQLSGQR